MLRFLRSAFLLCSLGLPLAAIAQPIQLYVDASDCPHLLMRVHETFPVGSGALALYYPQWIPGEHGPDGPLGNLVDLHFHAGGQEIPWTRDPIDSYEFHLTIPRGETQLEADFVDANSPDSAMNADLARISWHRDLLYPGGKRSDDITVQATLQLPEGWKWGSALPLHHQDKNQAVFKPISLTRLIDNPVVAGAHFNRIVLLEQPLHEMDIAGDTDEEVQVPPAIVDNMKRLVAEEYAYFGARHYDDYHFLLTASAHGGYMGLEHNESSEDGLGPNGMKDAGELGYLVCHEMTHSWNGKYRRPAGLATPNYEVPMQGELLWVYEGFTEFTGTMLTVRAGFWTPDMYREHVATLAALLGSEQRRTWRPVADTAVSAHDFGGGGDWGAERGITGDYYFEMVLVWLDVDAAIRRLTGDHKSIDDFARLFFGPPSTGPIIRPYHYEDIVRALGEVVPNDWDKFLRERVYDVHPATPVGGIEGDGWELVWNDQPNRRSDDRYGGGPMGMRYAIGLRLGGDGTIQDAIIDTPAFRAGLCPGMRITEINGKPFSMSEMGQAIKSRANIIVKVRYDGHSESHTIEYGGGPMEPHLARDSSKPDYLSELTAPRAGNKVSKSLGL